MSAYIAEVNAALTALLRSDATLTTLLGGPRVYFHVAPQGLTQFVLVTLDTHADAHMFSGKTAYEVVTYLVKAVMASTDPAAASAVAARVHALLDQQTLTLTNYGVMALERLEHVEFGEVDDVNRTWQHSGGVYELWVAPVTTP